MNPNETFNWPDGDIILHATGTNGTGSRDFRVHKVFLSFSSPIFRDLFQVPQPPPAAGDGVEVVDIADPPRALELILRIIYPSSTPFVVDDLTVLSEALVLADKYDIQVARSRLRSSFTGLIETDPLRAYAIACRYGWGDEMKVASSHTTSIHLPSLDKLPEEFKLIPATEYHRLILLHSEYREQVRAIARRTPLSIPILANVIDIFASLSGRGSGTGGMEARQVVKGDFGDRIREGIPVDHRSLFFALKSYDSVTSVVPDEAIHFHVSSILSQASDLNLTV